MSLLNEAQGAPKQLQSTLDAGVEQISQDQTVKFTQYTKYVTPTDGYVFWVANNVPLTVKGSLHRITERHQDEDQTLARNQFIFTAEEEVTQLNTVSPEYLWVGEFNDASTDGATLQIVFNGHHAYYEQAGLWHYYGDAVYPALANLLIANGSDLPSAPIVSNSLPIWLTQNSISPVYPSYLVPDNIQPPYISVHIEEVETDALGAFPVLTVPPTPVDPDNPATFYEYSVSQLCSDNVYLTFYGYNNQQIYLWFETLIDYSRNTDNFGFQNSPVVRDAKRHQSEITAVAMKKTMHIKASYYQSAADAIMRRLILSAGFSS